MLDPLWRGWLSYQCFQGLWGCEKKYSLSTSCHIGPDKEFVRLEGSSHASVGYVIGKEAVT